MSAAAPTANLADLVLPTNLDAMPRRDILAFFDAHGLFPISPRQSADDLRTLLRSVTARARRERDAEQRQAVLDASEARCATVNAEVEAAFTSTPLPRRALSDALAALRSAAGDSGFDQDRREASLLWAVDSLVAVLRAAADPSSEVTLEDALLEADRAERAATNARRTAAMAREEVARRLRDSLRSLEEGR
jgi:hypothetical protein